MFENWRERDFQEIPHNGLIFLGQEALFFVRFYLNAYYGSIDRTPTLYDDEVLLSAKDVRVPEDFESSSSTPFV